MTEPILDPAAFAHLLEITGGDLEFVDELVDTYLDDADAQLAAMRAGGGRRRRRGDRPTGPQPEVEQRQRRGGGAGRGVPRPGGRRPKRVGRRTSRRGSPRAKRRSRPRGTPCSRSAPLADARS